MQRSKGLSMMPAGDALANRGRSYSSLWIVLLALTLRLHGLAFQPLWWDEGWSVYFATTNVGNMLRLTAVDIHPPFYYLLLHFWIGLLGSSPLAIRALSVLIGTAAVPLLYVTGRRLFGARAGLLAAFLLAISPFHIYYSQEVRMYGLVTLLGLAAFYFALRWESSQRFGSWAGYVVTATAALYTQYYAAFLLLALNLVLVLRWLKLPSFGRKRKRPVVPDSPHSPALSSESRGGWWVWLGAQITAALLYLPWLWYAGAKLLTYVRFKVGIEQYPAMDLFTYLGRHLAAFDWGHAEGVLAGWWWLGLLPLVLLLVALALARHPGSRESGTGGLNMSRWPAAILLVVLACGFAVNLIFPFNPQRGERLLLIALPAYLLLIGAALAALSRQRRLGAALATGAFLAMGVLSLAFFYTVPRYPDDDYRPVADQLRALALPTDAIVCIHPWQVGYFESYLLQASRPALVLTPREVLPRERQLWADDPALMAADLDALLTGHGRMWLPAHQAMGQILEKQIERYLIERAYPVLDEWHGKNTVLALFASGEPVAQPVTARFGGWLALGGAALSPGPLQAGRGIVAVDLAWQIDERPTDDYTVGLRLVGPTGYVWAQRDAPPLGGQAQFSEWPAGERQIDHHGLLVPAGTPPGDYRVVLQVYRSQDVAVLPATFEGGSGGEVTLGTVRVVRPDTPPPVEALAYRHALQVEFGDRLKLLGFRADSDSAFRPGESVAVDLFWQAVGDPGEDFLPRLQLLDANGKTWADLAEKPVAGTYPTAWWRAGDLVRDPHALPIPAAIPAGRYRLVLSLLRAADGQPVEIERGQTTVDLAEIQVQGREHFYEPPTPEQVQVARLDDSVELVGYDLESAGHAAGSSLQVTLYWHALETPDRSYYAFVHLLDGEGSIVAQHDGPPGNGELPTLGWLPGEYLADPHSLQILSDLPGGSYRLAAGLYDPATGQRLGDRIVLDTPVLVTSDR